MRAEVGMSPKPKTVLRKQLKVLDFDWQLWQAFVAMTRMRGMTASDGLEEVLRTYINKYGKQLLKYTKG